MYKRLIVIFGFVVVLFAYAPTYLAYSDKPIKSDAIVLFVGPDYEARLKEAHKLIEEGYANTIIIPAQNKVLVVIDGTLRKGGQPQKNSLEKLEQALIPIRISSGVFGQWTGLLREDL